MKLLKKLLGKDQTVPQTIVDNNSIEVQVEYWNDEKLITNRIHVPKTIFVFHRSDGKWLVINEVIKLIKKETSLNYVKLESIKLV